MDSKRINRVLEIHDDASIQSRAFKPKSLRWQPLPLRDPNLISVNDEKVDSHLKDSDWAIGFHYKDFHICVPNLVIGLTHAVTFTLSAEESVLLFH